MSRQALPRKVRISRGAALIAGAAIYAALVYGPLEFLWTPFLLGVAYLAAAAAGGRRGGLWATGLVLAGWGIGVLMSNKLDMGVSTADGYLIGVGLAALVGGVLARSGFSVDLVGVGATALLAGMAHTYAGDTIPALVEPWPYVVLLGVVGAVNLAFALAPQKDTATDARTARAMGSTAEPSPSR